VAELIARTPFAGLLPIAHGGVTATEVDPGPVVSVSRAGGTAAEVSDGLGREIGLAFPGPGETLAGDGVRVVWSGMDQCFVLGARPAAIPGAATTDQSDAWAVVALEGGAVRDVLARLVPVDLRDAAFPEGRAARTLLGHMSCLLLRTGPESFEAMVFRSMAGSAAHELDRAMRLVAGRAGL
jgi:sarcosine oxidase subunit gamma